MFYLLYIKTRSGVKIYWNRILNTWMDHPGSASPFTAEEIVGMQPLPFGIKTEKQWNYH